MALTFLDLTNSLLVKFNEEKLTSSDFLTSYGFQDLCKDAINDTIRDINQAEWFWPFNYTEGTITTTADQQKYTVEADSKVTDWNSFYLVKDDSKNVNGQYLRLVPYDYWNRYYREIDNDYTSGTKRVPDRVFFYPDSNIGLSPIPSDTYTIKYNYYVQSDELVAHDDTTRIPDHFKSVIIDGAAWYVYMAQEDAQKAAVQWERYQARRDKMRALLINKPEQVYIGKGSVNYSW
jgi:hypothetical protein